MRFLSASSDSSSPRVRVLRSEEHTSELQSPCNLVCRLLLEKKNKLFARLIQLIGRARVHPDQTQRQAHACHGAACSYRQQPRTLALRRLEIPDRSLDTIGPS